jgi:hypothetical protein
MRENHAESKSFSCGLAKGGTRRRGSTNAADGSVSAFTELDPSVVEQTKGKTVLLQAQLKQKELARSLSPDENRFGRRISLVCYAHFS